VAAHGDIRQAAGDGKPANDAQGLLARLQAAPDDYDANARLGLLLAERRDLLLKAEPFLVRALAHGRCDGLTPQILDTLGEIYMRRGNLREAVSVFRSLVDLFPGVVNYYFRLGDALSMAGEIPDASRPYRYAMDLLDANVEGLRARTGRPVPRILAPIFTLHRHMGEIGATLDLFLKARALGLTGDFEAVLLAPPDETPNPALVDCLRPHVRVVSDRDEIHALREHYGACAYFANYTPLRPDLVANRDLAYGAVQRMWAEAGGEPLVRFPEARVADCRAALATLGVGAGDDFVCLHVRERGFYGEQAGLAGTPNDFRNPDIANYLPAARALAERGFRVVRLGDSSMQPIPCMDRVIDYAHSPLRNPWLDVYCIAKCRFIVGSPSGPTDVARLFNVPVLATDFLPLGAWPFGRADLFLPKLRRCRRDGRPLTLAEAMRPPLLGNINPLLFDMYGIAIVDNTADEIVEGVADMIARLEGSAAPSEADTRAQAAFARAGDPYALSPLVPVASSFLRRHPEWVAGG
jgi:putative glycosyltransferase (TIGR04372 family)